jgi:hypothetical protein
VIGIVFAVSAISKLRSPAAYRAYAQWLRSLPVPLASRRLTATVLVGAEVLIVPLVAVPATAFAGLQVSTLLIVVLTAGLVLAVRHGVTTPCHCFGASPTPVSHRQAARNIVLLVVAVLGLLGGHAGNYQPAAAILSVGVAAAIAMFIIFSDDIAVLLQDVQLLGRGRRG